MSSTAASPRVVVSPLIEWLLASDEPWTRYRTLLDLLGRPADSAEVLAARSEMLNHPGVKGLIAAAASWPGYPLASWPGYPLQRHNDAKHPLHALTVLADFGLTVRDPGMAAVAQAILAGQADDGPFRILTNIPARYGGSGEDGWHWSLCDAPVTLHALIAFGLADDPRVERAAAHLVDQVSEDGWRCVTASGFRGPGRKADPCPLANLLALRALALRPEHRDGEAARRGAEMVLGHWEQQTERKMYLFGIGTDFRKLKYPLIWYDLLHATHVLSQFPWLHDDRRLGEMLEVLAAGADANGRYTPESVWRAWKGWSFGQKKASSPWMTLVATRVLQTRKV
jgi:hypothetical protein